MSFSCRNDRDMIPLNRPRNRRIGTVFIGTFRDTRTLTIFYYAT